MKNKTILFIMPAIIVYCLVAVSLSTNRWESQKEKTYLI